MIVLLSGGLDSTVNLYEAANYEKSPDRAKLRSNVKLALTFDYGQRAAQREIECAGKHCSALGVPHKIINLPWLAEITNTSLVNRTASVPMGVSLEDGVSTKRAAEAVWVPNRNGVFLNIAAAVAESLKAKWVVPGFNKEEASTFPDNSEEFIESLNTSFAFSTSGAVRVKCFTSGMDKKTIVARSKVLGIDLNAIWPCYLGENEPCGTCESCLRFRRAIG